MDLDRTRAVRDLLESTGWVDRTRRFATSLRRARRDAGPGSLLLVGTPTEEPWHLTAHLDDEARWFDLPELAPTLVRWAPPADAPAHLAVGMRRLEEAARGETVMVVAPDDPTEHLLERVADARRAGAVILAIDGTDDTGAELAGLAHDALRVPPDAGTPIVTPTPAHLDLSGARELPPVSFEVVTHLVSVAAVEPLSETAPQHSLRERIGRLLDFVSGPDQPA